MNSTGPIFPHLDGGAYRFSRSRYLTYYGFEKYTNDQYILSRSLKSEYKDEELRRRRKSFCTDKELVIFPYLYIASSRKPVPPKLLLNRSFSDDRIIYRRFRRFFDTPSLSAGFKLLSSNKEDVESQE